MSSNLKVEDILTRLASQLVSAPQPLRYVTRETSASIQLAIARVYLTIKQLRDEFAPTADQAQLERATKQLLRLGIIEKPAGAERPTKVEVTASNFVRDPRVRAWVLSNADGFCEACGNRAPFSTDEGLPFLEVHHVKTLADRGSDRTTNAVALCPNCHRRFHYSADRESLVKSLYKRVQRLLRE